MPTGPPGAAVLRAHQLFQRVIDVGGVSRAIARDGAHPVAVVIGVVEGLSAGAHLLRDVAARIMREHPEAAPFSVMSVMRLEFAGYHCTRVVVTAFSVLTS